jgi:hypothetical protein
MVDLPKMCLSAAAIAASYFTAAARNANVLLRKKDDFTPIDTSTILPQFASQQISLKSPLFIGAVNLDPIFAPVQTNVLIDWFEANKQSQLLFMLVGCATGVYQFTPTFARDLFELHSTIQIMNGCVHGLAQGKSELKSTLGAYCDLLLLQSKLFEEALIHAASTATDELAVAFLQSLLGLKVGENFTDDLLKEGKDRHARAVTVYRSRWDDATAALLANAYNKQQMTIIAKQPVTLRTMPVWFMCPYSSEDVVINDTWVPKLWGESLMKTIVEEQAKAIATEHQKSIQAEVVAKTEPEY